MSRLTDLVEIVENMDGDDLTFPELEEVMEGFYKILLWCDYSEFSDNQQLRMYRALNYVALAKTELQLAREN